MASNERKATIVGISGCSSSGKTTLSRLLRDIFPHTYILHEDDFYKAEKDLPRTPHGHLDWDCADALDLPALVSSLDHIHAHATLPATLTSKEDQNPTHDAAISTSTMARLRDRVADWLASFSSPPPPPSASVSDGRRLQDASSSPTSSSPNSSSSSPNSPSPPLAASRPLVLVDGFLLYPPCVSAVRDRLDVALFLTARYEDVRRRRAGRGGYATLEGWWEDPEGYVEEVVWRNYVRDHGFLFVGGDVQGDVDEGVVGGLGVKVCPAEGDGGMGMGMEGVLGWAVGEVMGGLERGRRGGGMDGWVVGG